MIRTDIGFTVIYRWVLRPNLEDQFVDAWSRVTLALRNQRGSLGSRLHRGADGLWYGYAQWPNAEARRSAFSQPVESEALQLMRAAVQESLPEIHLETVSDFLVLPHPQLGNTSFPQADIRVANDEPKKSPSRLPEELSTSRLCLRSPVSSDAESIFASYAQDPQVCRFMVWSAHTSVAQTQEFIDSCIHGWKIGERLAFVITEKGSSVAIGMLEARVRGSTIDVGYVLARAHWGKGFMPEAIESLTGAALGNSATFRIQAFCDTANIPSQRALEKSGFTREGRLDRYAVHPNISPEPSACFMYAKCR